MLRNIIFALTLIFIQNSAIAGSLFTSEVVINTDDLGMEKAAKKEAFTEVLVRVSGQLNVDTNPEIKKAFLKMDEYITQISYGSLEGHPSLILKFDGNKLRTLLIKSNLPYWGTPRSDVLFWMVEDSLTHRQLIWEPSASPFLQDLKAQGERRGLPVIIPKGDFDDILAISIPDVWGNFVEPIAQASARYKPSGVVVVKVGEKRITWQFYPNANKLESDFPLKGVAEGTNAQMAKQIIGDITHYYVENFAVNQAKTNETVNETKVLEISHLNSAEDFFALERTLKALNSVGSLRLDSISNGKAIFSVNLLAPVHIFHNEMRKERRLSRVGSNQNVVVMPDQPFVDSFDPHSNAYVSNQTQLGDLSLLSGEPSPEDSGRDKVNLNRPNKQNKEKISLIELDIRAENENSRTLLVPDIYYQWKK